MRSTAPSSASVVIIGGGIMGTAAAHYLAEAGVEDIVLLERDELGSGSTSRAAGGLRSQFSDAVNIQLGARSLEIFRTFDSEFDQNIDLVGSGYLFLLDNDSDADAFEANVALQRSQGQNSRMITAAEAADLSPVISTEGLVAGAFNPDDAHCTPEGTVAGFAHAARRRGVTTMQHASVTDIVVEDGRITGVETSAGPITAEAVVCAAGAWSQAIGEMVGVELPVTPLRRHVMVSEPVGFDARRLPFTIDFSTSYYFHSEGEGLLFGAPERTDVREFNTHFDPRWPEHLSQLISRRTPTLEDVCVRAGWAGLYECTPDHNALIGKSPDISGFFYACGFSGHGFLQGPAVGEVIRDLYLGVEPFVDISGMSAERFSTNALRVELNIV